MSKVFVVQDTRRYEAGAYVSAHDLTPAEQYGELIYLLSPTAAPWKPEGIITELWDKLEDFSDDDYLLMVGNPVLIGLATAVACDVNKGRVRFLQWHGRSQSYTPVEAQVFDPIAG